MRQVVELIEELRRAEGRGRLPVLGRLAWELRDADPDRALGYADELRDVGDEHEGRALIAEAWVVAGRGDCSRSLELARRGRFLVRHDLDRAHSWFTEARTHVYRGDGAAARAAAREAQEIYRSAGEADYEARLIGVTGSAAYLEGRFDESEKAYRAAIDRAEAPAVRGALSGNLAEALRRQGNIAEAVRLYGQALEEVPLDQAPDVALTCLLNLSRVQIDSGDYASAVDHLTRALDVCAQTGLRLREPRVHTFLCYAHHAANNPERAQGHARAAVAAADAIDSPAEKAVALSALALALDAQGETEQALDHLREAARIHAAHGQQSEHGDTLRTEGELLLKLDRSQEARAALEQAVALHGEHENPLGLGADETLLAAALVAQDAVDEALLLLARALARAREHGFRSLECGIHRNFASAYKRKGAFESALKHLEQADEIDRELRGREAAERLDRVHELAAVQAAEREAAVQKRMNEELRGANDALRETQRALHDLLGAVAHQLRNPLTGIVGGASLAAAELEKGRTDGVGDHVQAVLRAAGKMKETIDRLLAIEGAPRPLRPERVDLCAVADATVRLFERAARIKGLELVVRPPTPRPGRRPTVSPARR